MGNEGEITNFKEVIKFHFKTMQENVGYMVRKERGVRCFCIKQM